jgi:histidinol-phosphate aminotransferase
VWLLCRSFIIKKQKLTSLSGGFFVLEAIMKTQKKTPAKGFQKLYAFQVRGEIDLSVSENPLGCSPLVVNAFRRLKPHFNDYPDPHAIELRKALAVFFRCQPDNVLIGNGSESIIPILFRMFVGLNEEVIVPQLTFPMFTFTGELLKTNIIHSPMTKNLGINLREIEKRITAATKMIIVCNPNNPTGAVISRRELMAFLDRVPKNIVVVIDEANIEFGGKSVLPPALHFPNVLVLRTFSKAFGLAALRVGCLVGESQLIQKNS